MEAGEKTCSKCGDTKPVVCFGVRSRSRDGLNPQCFRCSRESHRKNYEGSKSRRDSIKRSVVACKERNYRAVLDYLLVNPCVDCGEGDPVVLDFDHVSGDKVGDVSAMACCGLSLDRILEEMEKCVVRCSNCHRRKTARDFGFWRMKMLESDSGSPPRS